MLYQRYERLFEDDFMKRKVILILALLIFLTIIVEVVAFLFYHLKIKGKKEISPKDLIKE